MNALRAAIGVAALAMAALLTWAIVGGGDLHGSFAQQLSVLTTLPWGIASLADLYLGFGLFAVLVFLTERSWLIALIWAAPVLVLGNLWAAIWFVVRLPHLTSRLSQANWSGS